MQVVTIFCEFCSGILLEQDSETSHAWCYEEVMAYRKEAKKQQAEFNKERKKLYSVKLRIAYSSEYRLLSEKIYINTVYIQGNSNQAMFIDFIYEDLKQIFIRDEIELSFPLIAEPNDIDFTVAKGWALVFPGSMIGFAGAIFSKDELDWRV